MPTRSSQGLSALPEPAGCWHRRSGEMLSVCKSYL